MAKLLCASAAGALATLARGENVPMYPPAESYTVSGACGMSDGINGLTFVKEGVTRNGSPYYKASTSEKYLYFDPDCEGGSGEPMRWIFDNSRPDVNKLEDLDNDLACQFIASIDTTDASRPPSGKWSMFCDDIEEERYLTLREGGAQMSLATKDSVRVLTWDGACALKSFLNGKVFEEVGATADGRPFFKAQGRDEHIYFDADCDGAGSASSARWVLDNGRPSTTATRDLDQDGRCDYHARFDGDSQRPPSGSWRMFCGDVEGWVSVPVTLRESVVSRQRAVNAAGSRGVLVAAVATLAAAAVTALGL